MKSLDGGVYFQMVKLLFPLSFACLLTGFSFTLTKNLHFFFPPEECFTRFACGHLFCDPLLPLLTSQQLHDCTWLQAIQASRLYKILHPLVDCKQQCSFSKRFEKQPYWAGTDFPHHVAFIQSWFSGAASDSRSFQNSYIQQSTNPWL